MQRNNYFEIIVGTFVLICAAWFFFNSFKSAKIRTNSGYLVMAKFDDAGGIESGSDVKISGVKVGFVENFNLDAQTFRAILQLNIDNAVKLPLDTSAKIVSSGLLGEKYVELNPGGDEENLKNGEEIQYTQSSVNFEQLLGKFIFSDKGSDKDADKNSAKKEENKNGKK